MHFRDLVTQLDRSMTVGHAQDLLRATYGRHASAWLSEEAGISRRTARRWLSGNFPPARAGAIRDAARAATTTHGVAAARLRGLAQSGGTISVGHVHVAYDETDQGVRNIGDLTVDEWMVDDLAAAADALDAGNLDLAADAFSDAIIGGYQHGLEDTLTVADFVDGITITG